MQLTGRRATLRALVADPGVGRGYSSLAVARVPQAHTLERDGLVAVKSGSFYR